MAGLPQVFLAGNLVAEPELKFSNASGKAVLKLRVACNERKRNDAGEWVDGDTTFISVTLFGRAAETVAETVSKGTRVMCAGKLKQRTWEQDGQKRSDYEVLADDVAAFPKSGGGKSQEGSGWGQQTTAWGNDGASEPPF